jgi:hypothetical protein
MQELFPLVSGAVIGLLVQRLRPLWLRVVALVVLCLVFGFLASYLSGELNVSWGFLSVDMALVWLGALAAVALSSVWSRRRTTTR